MALNQTQQDALSLMEQTLNSWGLGALIPDLRKLIVKGDTNPDTLTLALSQTDAYKARFDPVNAPRRAAGLAELRPADIVALEEQYRNVMQAYNLPQATWGDRQLADKLLAGGVSASELQQRVQAAHDQYETAPDYVKRLWTQYFGTKGDAISMILDPTISTQTVLDRAQQVSIGGAAAANGVNVNQQRAQQFQQAGVTLDQARQAYQLIARNLPTDQTIAQRFGSQFSQGEEENDLLLGNAAADQKRQQLYNSEEALFRTNSAFDSSSLGISQSQAH